jgi:hypothetical protein
MGWTITDLGRYGKTLEQAKADHVAEATRYGEGVKAEMIAHEWHAETFYAIIRLSGGRYEKPVTFFRTDMIEQSPVSFGYKDQSEEMGPYCKNRPSRAFAALVYKHIPEVSGYAMDFRKRMGIKYDLPQLFEAESKQLEMI